MTDHIPQALDYWVRPADETGIYAVSQLRRIGDSAVWCYESQKTEREVYQWINRLVLSRWSGYNDFAKPAGYYREMKYHLTFPHASHCYRDDQQLRQSFRPWFRWLPCRILWRWSVWSYYHA